MTINIANLLYNINRKVSNDTSNVNLLFLTKAVENLETGSFFTVIELTDLPPAADHVNELYYVINQDGFYVSDSVLGWQPLNTQLPV